jgi:hypothetical protein
MTIEHTWELALNTEEKHAGHQKLMCTRGLLMLLHMECLEEFDWHDTSERLCDLFWKFYEEAVVHRDLSAE